MNAWRWTDDYEYIPVTYTWEAEERNYIAPPSPTILPILPPPNHISTINNLTRAAKILFQNRDYNLVITNLAEAVELTRNSQAIVDILQLRYLGAIVLEALNRTDEALLEYITIYKAAPGSAWGMLAALHLEIIPQ